MKNSKIIFSGLGLLVLVLCVPLFAFSQNKLDCRNEKADERVQLEKDKQAAVELHAMTVELIELHHQAKQFHWNIVVPLYLPWHELLDDYDDIYLDYADPVAERLLQIGVHVEGRTETITKTANLGVVPTGAVTDKQVLDLFSVHVFIVAVRTRQRIIRLGKLDEVSSNLFQELSYKLDKQVWQLWAHQQ